MQFRRETVSTRRDEAGQTRGFICHPFAGVRLRGFRFVSTHPVLKHWALICLPSGPVIRHSQAVPSQVAFIHKTIVVAIDGLCLPLALVVLLDHPPKTIGIFVVEMDIASLEKRCVCGDGSPIGQAKVQTYSECLPISRPPARTVK